MSTLGDYFRQQGETLDCPVCGGRGEDPPGNLCMPCNGSGVISVVPGSRAVPVTIVPDGEVSIARLSVDAGEPVTVEAVPAHVSDEDVLDTFRGRTVRWPPETAPDARRAPWACLRFAPPDGIVRCSGAPREEPGVRESA